DAAAGAGQVGTVGGEKADVDVIDAAADAVGQVGGAALEGHPIAVRTDHRRARVAVSGRDTVGGHTDQARRPGEEVAEEYLRVAGGPADAGDVRRGAGEDREMAVAADGMSAAGGPVVGRLGRVVEVDGAGRPVNAQERPVLERLEPESGG